MDFQGTISDINIPYVNVRYQPIQNFQISLISPIGTEVILYDRNCFTTDLVNIGFDDDAPQTIQCPPTMQTVYQPANPLAAFENQGTQGVWQLKTRVLQSGFGSPGRVDDWSIEFCAAASPTVPVVSRNEPLCVRPLESAQLNNQLLQVTDATQSPFDLEYTVVSLPQGGTLSFLGNTLGVGDVFRQSSIDAGNVVYTHTDENVTSDQFAFIVQDGTGGFVPVTLFEIVGSYLRSQCYGGSDGWLFQRFPQPYQ
ncbi:MAG: cadherin-like domain-containing protein [Saprospiraceae bacterium]